MGISQPGGPRDTSGTYSMGVAAPHSQTFEVKLAAATQTVSKLKQAFKLNLAVIAKSDLSEAIEHLQPSKKGMYAAQRLESILPIELTDTDHNRPAGLFSFDDPEIAYLGRTLTNRGSGSAKPANIFLDGHEADKLQQLAMKEFKTLTNEVPYNIVITPATLVQPNTPVELISSRQDRNEWYGLPSVIFAVPKKSTGASRLKPYADSSPLHRSSFSHFQSFASNKAFGETKEELSQFKNLQKHMTPTESIQQLKHNVLDRNLTKSLNSETTQKLKQTSEHAQRIDQLTRKVPFDNLEDFSGQLTDWANAVTKAQGTAAVHHNEVAIRLWPWDITHVSTGSIDGSLDDYSNKTNLAKSTQHALEVAAVLAIEKYALAEEFLAEGEGKGIHHPVFNDWLRHTHSFDPTNHHARNLHQLEHELNKLSTEDKQTMLLDLASKLLESISLIEYSPQQKGFGSPQGLKNLPIETVNKIALLCGEKFVGLEQSQLDILSKRVHGVDVEGNAG